jgi:hypothetical protein
MFPAAPELTAVAEDDDRIRLTWVNKSQKAKEFRLEHILPGGGFEILYQGADTSRPHENLAPGSQHQYQVVALVDGVDDSVPKKIESAPSNPASATTLKWEPSFATTNDPASRCPALGWPARASCSASMAR